MSDTNFEFASLKNNDDDNVWLSHFGSIWPSCKAWYLSEGLLRRPGYQTCLSALKTYMPEIVPIYLSLLDKVGGSDIAGRFLSLYNPPPYMAGCSQAVWDRESLFLAKNYDYSSLIFERTLLHSNWLRPVIGVLDCAWGLLDGMNDGGLIVSLTFGGKKEIGEGFGAPIILRYILETCSNVEEAKLKLELIPCHMAYNLILLDADGNYCKVYLCPGKKAIFIKDAVTTNHQERIDWLEYAEFSKTIERYNFLKKSLLNKSMNETDFINSFFKKPLYNLNFEQQFGTLYTVLYNPKTLSLAMLWNDERIDQSFANYNEAKTSISIKG